MLGPKLTFHESHGFWLITLDGNSMNRGSAVGITTGCGLDHREVGVRVPVESRILISPYRPDRLKGPPNLLSNGDRGLFPRGVMRHEREADHSQPLATLPYVFMA
jgi:hypothetical protein